ncbi:bile acid:sodium symporter family protein [Planctomicrobium piriforme]|uniref:Solute carrier family 10 (Sodium/bile acid cotransporter), member 7 n=1 Tax=Planctomicrobium piriforme TaxID=1576369 RepID=A0A1I3JC17_9PLAN|nr:bile acid:sodium symporter family protein [Planctomicrobium piriforme]SFI57749.1 solute carrier family 10 (sodium/bile acid cotransporter), member 7 [Planctomicrobium piriforme]
MKKKRDWFLPGMVLAVFLAWLFPQPGADGGWLHPELITSGGVALIFFLHGVALSFAALRSGMLLWKLHLVVQGCVFLLFPLIGLGLYAATAHALPDDLRVGFLYLCALPSTVSSSVALTAAAHGNVPAAVFNATISSLLGVVLTPLWMSTVAEIASSQGSLGKVVLNLCFWLVLPLIVGQLSRPWLGNWAARHKPFINTVDRGTILLLVYTSFCDSFVLGVWTQHGLTAVLATIVLTTLLFWLVFWTVGAICTALKFNREDRIATLFCGSKKSLATGVPMAQLMFGSDPGLGLILLPIMVYHPLQLVICGVLAGRWAKEHHTPAPPLGEILAAAEPSPSIPDEN